MLNSSIPFVTTIFGRLSHYVCDLLAFPMGFCMAMPPHDITKAERVYGTRLIDDILAPSAMAWTPRSNVMVWEFSM